MTKTQAQGPSLVEATSSAVGPTKVRTPPLSAKDTAIQTVAKANVERDVKAQHMPRVKKSTSTHRLGPKDTIGAGDSRIIHDVLSSSTVHNAFELLKEEVGWETMHHRSGKVPRLVAVQGAIDEASSVPIYRHPTDESPALLPFIPVVEEIKEQIEKILHQPFNHALIQLYRDGIDNISEHSDKVR